MKRARELMVAQGKKTRRAKSGPLGKEAWNDPPEFGVFYLHDVLHMAEYFSRAVDRELGEHPAVKDNPEFLALAEAANGALWDLYQKIAAAYVRAHDAMELALRDKS